MDSREMERIKQELAFLRKEQGQFLLRIMRLEQELKVLEVKESVSVKPDMTELKPEFEKPSLIDSASQVDKQELEFRIGGTWLNRIGVVAVILGLAYFLKWSFDNQLIGPTGRVLLGLLLGLIMLGLGEKLKTKYAGYAQGLLGGGSLALFFSVYSSYQFYHLISPLFAYLFLVVIMINTVFMAIRHNSLPIGSLGIVGGYAIPFLIGSDHPSVWALLSYISLLTAAVLAVSIYKKWPLFQYLSFVFSQLLFAFVWLTQFAFGGSRASLLFPLLSFLVILFLLFLGVASVYNIRTKKAARQADMGLIILNALSFFAWSVELLDITFLSDYMGFYAVFLALVYIYLGKMAHRLFPEDKGHVYSLFVVSFILITVAIPLQFKGATIGFAWLAESVGLIFLARKLKVYSLIGSGLLVLALSLVITFISISMFSTHKIFLLNTPSFLLLGTIAAVRISSRLLKEMDDKYFFYIRVRSLLHGLLLLLIFTGLTVENDHFFTLHKMRSFLSPEQLTLSGLWLLYATALFIFGLRRKNRNLRYVSLGLLAVIIVKAFFIDLAQLAIVFKILLFMVLGLFLLGISYLYQKQKDLIWEEQATKDEPSSGRDLG